MKSGGGDENGKEKRRQEEMRLLERTKTNGRGE